MDPELEVRHVGWVGGCMGLIAYRGSDNVATATGSVDVPTRAALISLLICDQMENADSGFRRPPGRPPVDWVERTRFQNPVDTFRNGPSSRHFQCPSHVKAHGLLSCPANVIAHLEPIPGVVREAASFRLSTAQRADRADHLAAPLRRSVVDSVVALRGKATGATEG